MTRRWPEAQRVDACATRLTFINYRLPLSHRSAARVASTSFQSGDFRRSAARNGARREGGKTLALELKARRTSRRARWPEAPMEDRGCCDRQRVAESPGAVALGMGGRLSFDGKDTPTVFRIVSGQLRFSRTAAIARLCA
jgi:hypothetical protein